MLRSNEVERRQAEEHGATLAGIADFVCELSGPRVRFFGFGRRPALTRGLRRCQSDLERQFLPLLLDGLWQTIEEPERRVELRDGLCMRRPPGRLLPGEGQVLHRLLATGAPFIMMGEVAVVLIEPLRVERLDDGCGPPVELRPPRDEKRIVGDVARQSMLEDVLEVRGRGLLVDELRGLQPGEKALQ
jgi:hypothetical protein